MVKFNFSFHADVVSQLNTIPGATEANIEFKVEDVDVVLVLSP